MSHYIKVVVCLLACLEGVYPQSGSVVIRSLVLEGNEHVSMNEVLIIIRQRPPKFFFRHPKFEPRLLKLDALTLKSFYHSKGFLDVKVDESYSVEDIYADIVYTIDEGKQYYLSKVDVIGNSLIPDELIKNILGLHISKPYNPVGINDNIYLIENEYHRIGKLFLSVTVQDAITDSIKVTVNIDEGKYFYIQKTFLEKIGSIDSSLIWRELTYSEGDLYSKTDMDNTSRKLRAMGVFSMANMIPVKVADSDSLVNMVIEFRRYKQREWNSTGGYDPIRFAEGAEPLPALSGTIEWRNRSFFNQPTQLSTKLMGGMPFEFWNQLISSPEFFIHYDIALTSNWILGIRLPSKLNLFYKRFKLEEQTEISERYGLEFTQKVRIVEHSFLKSEFVWQSFRGQSLDFFSDQPQENVEQRSIAVLVDRDKRDDPLFTRKGYYISGKLKSAGYVLGGERDYVKADLTFQAYVPLGRKSVLAGRIKSGRIWGWHYHDDVAMEKFYLGGSTSMRGWDFPLQLGTDSNKYLFKFKTHTKENIITYFPIGELIRLMTNIEYRFPVYKSVGLTFFVDGAILSSNMNEVVLSDFLWDGGIGITIDTPLGPARLDYAVQFDDPQTGKIQLGVQSLF